MHSLMVTFYLYDNLTAISDQICKKGLIHISNITMSKIYNSECVTPTAWKFGRGIFIYYCTYMRENSSLIAYPQLKLCLCKVVKWIGCIHRPFLQIQSHIHNKTTADKIIQVMSTYLVLMVKTLTSYLHKLHYSHAYNYVTVLVKN